MILYDVESRSRAILDDVGGRVYWRHPSSEALCIVYYDTDKGTLGLWRPGMRWPYDDAAVMVAHNGEGFDRFALARYDLPCSRREDTAQWAVRAGLGASLDALAAEFGEAKDLEGSKFTRKLSSVRRPLSMSAAAWKLCTEAQKHDAGDLPPITADTLDRVVTYCASDVSVLIRAVPDLLCWADLDEDVRRVHTRVNDRGVPFDRELANGILTRNAELIDNEISACAKELGTSPSELRVIVGSPAKCKAALGTDDARAKTLVTIDHPVARARRALASIIAGKCEAGLSRDIDGRLYDAHVYYGAHTGRWSGSGIQLQNLPRPEKRFEALTDDEIDALSCRVARGDFTGVQKPELMMLLRALVRAPDGKRLIVRDFSGIENRVLSWMSDDQPALDVIRSGRNPYLVLAAKLMNIPYEQAAPYKMLGKVGELACGYGQGAKGFELFAAGMGLDVRAQGFTGQVVVSAWRKLHAPAVTFWRRLESAFWRALDGKTTDVALPVGEISVALSGSAIVATLPSGRPIVYPHARQVAVVDFRGRVKAAIGYHGRAKDRVRVDVHGVPFHPLYGGLVTENIVSGACRDLMAACLVRAEHDGLCPVMHTHDEIVGEVDANAALEAEAALHEIMTTVPAEYEGLPLGAAGFSGRRYRK